MKPARAGERFGLRQWFEVLLGVAAFAVSLSSLWIALGTEQANRQMVAAASWPLLQADTADLPQNGRPVITFTLINGGVGPAKLKTLAIWWHGKAFAGAVPLLEACCGYKPLAGPVDQRLAHTMITTGGVHNVVILAGERRTFLSMPMGADNVAVWRRLNETRRQLTFRACYCSVFDECWVSNLMDLEPRRVEVCPAVKVLYVE